MQTPEDYKNNPIYSDITRLDHLSPQPTFQYKWNSLSGRWEPLTFTEITDGIDETNRILSGISGVIGETEDKETHRLLSGISGELTDIHVGVDLDHDTETHRLLSGVSGLLEELGVTGNLSISGALPTTPVKERTKAITQKIEEDFILLESIPETQRYGTPSGITYGQDRFAMEDIFGTHFNNARKINNSPETGHADFLIHAEWMDPSRPRDAIHTFDTDTEYGLRQENKNASLINSYELEDYNELYKRGLVDHITIFNMSPYPLQFHTVDETRNSLNDPVSPKTDDILFLDPDFAARINNDEAGRVFIKRPHTLSGYSVDYSITYKVPGNLEI